MSSGYKCKPLNNLWHESWQGEAEVTGKVRGNFGNVRMCLDPKTLEVAGRRHGKKGARWKDELLAASNQFGECPLGDGAQLFE